MPDTRPFAELEAKMSPESVARSDEKVAQLQEEAHQKYIEVLIQLLDRDEKENFLTLAEACAIVRVILYLNNNA